MTDDNIQIKLDKESIKKGFTKTKKVLSNKKVAWTIVSLLLILTVYIGTDIRTSGLQNLIDPTTEDYTPLALDPYYFLRVSESIIAGDMTEFDEFRYSVLNVPWSIEITPISTVFLYKIFKIVSPEITLNLVAVLNPVVFFILGLIIFFFLVYTLTKNKWIALICSAMLAIIPPYLYRTLAGFADHESIGMFGFFLGLCFFSMGLIYLEKKKSKSIYILILGIFSGLSTMFAIAAWGGGAKFLFMILPMSYIVFWLVKKEKSYLNTFMFYTSWLISLLLISPLFGETIGHMISKYMAQSSGILTLVAFGYTLIDTVITKKNLLNEKLSPYKELINLGALILIGSIIYHLFIGNVFNLMGGLLKDILNPFGSGRVGLTVAENRQPYLNDWISQLGNFIFYVFLTGCLIVGIKLSSGIEKKKYRPLFIGTFAFFVLGILYSRISAGSTFNGENFISEAFFFLSLLFFVISSIYIYIKSNWKIDTKWIIIMAWMIPMLLAVRSAIRVFFAIVPFVSLIVPIAVYEVGKFTKKTKDDLMKSLGYIIVIIGIIGLILSLSGFYNSVVYQAQNQHPSYTADWQKAMDWTRENTPEGSLFVHWWDYGYWVQTGGNRPTVTDGGHFNGYWDHLIGRYLLTTPNPDTAKSLMKTHEVNYLLIDPTDIGKYGAYSSIGDGKGTSDRASYLPTLISDPAQTQETRNGTKKLYSGGFYLDMDVIYEEDNKTIFLPKGKAALGGVFVEGVNQGYNQPTGVYVYNNQRHDLPIRYLSIGGQKMDFRKGVEATVHVFPNVVDGKSFEMDGALMYFSEKTMNSLVAELYVMEDPDNHYPELELVHAESQTPFIFNYQGFRGPIKIYKVHTENMTNILIREEFLETSGEYGELDDLEFRK